jgi:putative ABC transport system permease protein
MTGMEKPKSIVATGIVIFALGILFALLSAFLILGTTVFKEQFSESINQFLDYESLPGLVTILILLIFRAIYHIVMGIALAKGRNWGKMWFLWLSLVEIFLGLFSLDLIDVIRAGIFLIFLVILTRPTFTSYLGRVKIPYKYTFRSLFTRPLTTIMTVLGISFVAFIFCMILMLADGIAKVLVSTGEKDNIIFMEKDQFNEITSALTPEEVDMIENLGYFKFDPEMGEQLFSPELVASISLPDKKDTTEMKNLTIRGLVEVAPRLRENFNLLDGELYEMGLPTCIVGSSAAKRFAHCRIGDSINIAGDYFQVVGIFETGGTAYDSEIWTDIYSFRDSYNRAGVGGSIVLARMENIDELDTLKQILEDMPDLEVKVFSEKNYYAGQSEGTTTFIKMLGIFICIVFALGATIGAMITMYSAVANRINEIATMRALGFQAEGIQAAFLIESMSIGALGAVIGISIASLLTTFEIQMFSTLNFFGEFYLRMTLTLLTVMYTFIFAISMGFIGGVFPSIKATSMKIIDAFR